MTNLDYNVNPDSTDIFMIESLQNMKYYIQNFEMQAEFNLIANFSGLVDSDLGYDKDVESF